MNPFEERLKSAIRREMRDMRITPAPTNSIVKSWTPRRRPARRLVPWTAAAAAFAALLAVTTSWMASTSHHVKPATQAVSISGAPLRFPAKQTLFVSPKVGFALAVENLATTDTGPLAVYRTSDGGRSWSRVFQVGVSTAAPVKLRALGPSEIAVVGLTGTVYIARDAGGPWRDVQLPGQTTGADFVSFASPTVWYALGDVTGAMGTDFGTVYRSADAGATWHKVDKFTGFPMTGISFSGPLVASGWIGQISPNSGSAVLGRTAGGKSATGRVPLGTDSLRKFQLATNPPTFLSSSDGVLSIVTQASPASTWLSVTRDGGGHWSVPVRLPGNVYAFTDLAHVWATGDNRIWRSLDGGRTWQSEKLPKGYTVTSIDFASSSNGWALAQNGGNVWLLSTHDGGLHWATP